MADSNIVDPGNSSYSLPKPDAVSSANLPSMSLDRTLPRQISTGNQRGIQQLGSPNVYVDSGNEQIIVAKNETANVATPRVLMGNQVNYGEGFYVTKSGIDATTASSDSDFIFNSNQNVFKIVKTFDIQNDFDIPSTSYQSNLVSVPHGLTFVPAFNAFITLDNNLTLAGNAPTTYAPNPAVVEGAVAGNITIFTYSFVTTDSTNIYFQVDVAHYAAINGIKNTAKVYLLQETASITT